MNLLKNNKPTAIFDCDDVLLSFGKPFLDFVYEHYGIYVSYEQFYSYVFHKVMGVTQEKLDSIILDFYSSSEFASLPCVQSAPELIDYLYSNDFQIDCLTARTSTTRNVTQKQIEDYFSRNFTHLLFTKDIKTGKRWRKSELIRATYVNPFNIYYFIDDAAHNAIDVASVFPHIQVFLIGKPWNREFEFEKNHLLPSNVTYIPMCHVPADSKSEEKLDQHYLVRSIIHHDHS